MMPVRIALNVVYAMLVDGLDHEQREQFDSGLYGFAEQAEQANRRLNAEMTRGGEDQ